MHFAIMYKIRPEKRTEAVMRLLQTGGPPPEGAKIIQRWHDLACSWGITIAECDNPMALHKWGMQWNDTIELEIRQVINDEQAGAILSELFVK